MTGTSTNTLTTNTVTTTHTSTNTLTTNTVTTTHTSTNTLTTNTVTTTHTSTNTLTTNTVTTTHTSTNTLTTNTVTTTHTSTNTLTTNTVTTTHTSTNTLTTNTVTTTHTSTNTLTTNTVTTTHTSTNTLTTNTVTTTHFSAKYRKMMQNAHWNLLVTLVLHAPYISLRSLPSRKSKSNCQHRPCLCAANARRSLLGPWPPGNAWVMLCWKTAYLHKTQHVMSPWCHRDVTVMSEATKSLQITRRASAVKLSSHIVKQSTHTAFERRSSRNGRMHCDASSAFKCVYCSNVHYVNFHIRFFLYECVSPVLRNPVPRMRLDEGGKPIGVIVFLGIRACHLRQVRPNSLRPHLWHLHLMSQLSCDRHVWHWWFKQVGEHVQTIPNLHRGDKQWAVINKTSKECSLCLCIRHLGIKNSNHSKARFFPKNVLGHPTMRGKERFRATHAVCDYGLCFPVAFFRKAQMKGRLGHKKRKKLKEARHGWLLQISNTFNDQKRSKPVSLLLRFWGLRNLSRLCIAVGDVRLLASWLHHL